MEGKGEEYKCHGRVLVRGVFPSNTLVVVRAAVDSKIGRAIDGGQGTAWMGDGGKEQDGCVTGRKEQDRLRKAGQA